jgi:hypothetical protein
MGKSTQSIQALLTLNMLISELLLTKTNRAIAMWLGVDEYTTCKRKEVNDENSTSSFNNGIQNILKPTADDEPDERNDNTECG